MSNTPAINTNVRLFDLVRYMRQELHAADLITEDEYSWLCMEADMAKDPKGGSPSPRRLEDYDALRKENAALRKDKERLDWLDRHPFDLKTDSDGWTKPVGAKARLECSLRAAIDAAMSASPLDNPTQTRQP